MGATRTRRYDMRQRAAAADATRRRIIDATTELCLEHWYDEVTVREIATRAGVAPQTIVNHFGSKDGIIAASLEQPLPAELTTRVNARPGNISEAVALVVDDYERAGDALIRSLALEGRVPALRPVLERGRKGHRDWVRETFPAALSGLKGAAREQRLNLLVCATDVYTWKLLRRDRGLSQRQTADAIRQLVEALHP